MPKSPKAKPIRVTTFNLCNYLEPPNAFYEYDNIYTVKEWENKLSWISHCIQNLDSDIIAFQEVFSIDTLKNQLYSLGYPHFVCLDIPHIENNCQYSQPVLALASRFDITQAKLVSVSQNFVDKAYIEPTFRFSRQPLHAMIELPELGIIDIYVVHFKSQLPTIYHNEITSENYSIRTWLSTIQRGLEANSLYDSIKRTKQDSYRPCLLLGDFNQSLDSTEFSCLTSVKAERTGTLSENAFSLIDSWDLYCHQLSTTSLPGSRQPTHYHGSIGKVLDYILLSDEFNHAYDISKFEVIDYDVFDSHLVNPECRLDHLSTDHAIVTISIGLKDI